MRVLLRGVEEFVELQLSVSTADVERSYFTGEPDPVSPISEGTIPEGWYRVVEGRLCRILDQAAPNLRAQPE